jgi:hypothetical protein
MGGGEHVRGRQFEVGLAAQRVGHHRADRTDSLGDGEVELRAGDSHRLSEALSGNGVVALG